MADWMAGMFSKWSTPTSACISPAHKKHTAHRDAHTTHSSLLFVLSRQKHKAPFHKTLPISTLNSVTERSDALFFFALQLSRGWHVVLKTTLRCVTVRLSQSVVSWVCSVCKVFTKTLQVTMIATALQVTMITTTLSKTGAGINTRRSNKVLP